MDPEKNTFLILLPIRWDWKRPVSTRWDLSREQQRGRVVEPLEAVRWVALV